MEQCCRYCRVRDSRSFCCKVPFSAANWLVLACCRLSSLFTLRCISLLLSGFFVGVYLYLWWTYLAYLPPSSPPLLPPPHPPSSPHHFSSSRLDCFVLLVHPSPHCPPYSRFFLLDLCSTAVVRDPDFLASFLCTSVFFFSCLPLLSLTIARVQIASGHFVVCRCLLVSLCGGQSPWELICRRARPPLEEVNTSLLSLSLVVLLHRARSSSSSSFF